MDTNKRFERIFLATDGSEQSHAAVDVAIAIASPLTATVRVAHVWNLELHHRHSHWDVEVRREAEKLVDACVERLFRAGVIAQREIIRSDSMHVAASLAIEAKNFGTDLVVIGSRGLSDWQSLVGHSISHQLLSAVDCPVVIVRGQPQAVPVRISRILLAIAGGDDLGTAVRAAVAIAPAAASVRVVHVAHALFGVQGFAYVESADEIRDTMSRACVLLADAGLTVQGMVAHQGPVAKAVAEIANYWNADLIVVGSSRMRDIASLFLGSVSHDLLHATDRPVTERVAA